MGAIWTAGTGMRGALLTAGVVAMMPGGAVQV
jgi:hypothetical protein